MSRIKSHERHPDLHGRLVVNTAEFLALHLAGHLPQHLSEDWNIAENVPTSTPPSASWPAAPSP